MNRSSKHKDCALNFLEKLTQLMTLHHCVEFNSSSQHCSIGLLHCLLMASIPSSTSPPSCRGNPMGMITAMCELFLTPGKTGVRGKESCDRKSLLARNPALIRFVWNPHLTNSHFLAELLPLPLPLLFQTSWKREKTQSRNTMNFMLLCWHKLSRPYRKVVEYFTYWG